MTLPLDGFMVVALEQAVAAPLATRHLADLGARVIKVERPNVGDIARGYDHAIHGASTHFVWLNRGKESLAVDLTSPKGGDAVLRLIRRADVFVQNLAPGSAERLGLGADTLRATQPALVVANISGYGPGGPMADRKAYDLLIQAEAGLVSLTGTPETSVKAGIPAADIATGMFTSQAILAALLRRSRSGEGATIDVSMLESTLEWVSPSLYTQMFTGSQPARMGLSHSSIAPYGAYPTTDGEVLIGVQSNSAWNTLAREVLSDPAMAKDARFTTNVLRVQHRNECDAAISRRTHCLTTAELTARLAAARVPAAQVSQLDQLVNHPQLKARDRWRTIHVEGAEVPALLPPATFGDVEAAMGDVPALGQHTRSLLLESGLGAPDAADAITCGTATQAAGHDTSASAPDITATD